VVEHLDLCLGCLACETACPSGVDYSRLIEWGRTHIRNTWRRPPGQSLVQRLLVEWIFPYPTRFRWLLLPVRIGRRLGLFNLLRQINFGRPLARMVDLLPPLTRHKPLPEIIPAEGEQQYRVGFLTGCVAQVLYPGINEATVRVLAANGCEVIIPPDQVCCGALHLHNGNPEQAKKLMRQNINAFGRYKLDAIITNAAGCGLAMKEFGHFLGNDPAFAEQALEFQNKTRDICEFLVSLPEKRRPHPLRMRVTYHEPCHLAHGQKIRAQPRELIKSIPGIELIELNESDWCCGSAGVYNIMQPEMSRELLQRKIDNILATGAEVVVTGNPGCLLQIAYGLRSQGHPIAILHPVELLDRAYRNGEA